MHEAQLNSQLASKFSYWKITRPKAALWVRTHRVTNEEARIGIIKCRVTIRVPPTTGTHWMIMRVRTNIKSYVVCATRANTAWDAIKVKHKTRLPCDVVIRARTVATDPERPD